MKKFVIFVLSLLCILSLGGYSKTAFAEESNLSASTNVRTYYPYSIEDYVDLNCVKTFTVSDNNVYYVTYDDDYNYLHSYNSNTKQHKLIKTYNNLENSQINSVKVENGLLFVLTGQTLQVFNETDFTDVITLNFINVEPYEVNYNNNTYTFTTVTNDGSQDVLSVYKFTSLTETVSLQASLNLSYNVKNLAINNNYIYIVGSDNIFHIYDHTNLNSLTEYSNSTGHTPVLISTITDIEAFSENNKHYLCTISAYGLNIYNNEFEEQCSFSSTEAYITTPTILSINNLTSYVYDNTNSNIQAIKINIADKITLNTPSILLAGKGTELGRFDGVNDITLKNDETIVVSDKNNNRIQLLYKDSIKEIKFDNAYASNVILDKYNNLIFLKHTNSGLYLSGLSYNNATYNQILFTDKALSSTTSSMCLGLNGKLYLLDYSNNTISVLSSYNEPFTTIALSGVSLTQNSIIRHSNISNNFYINSNNIIYKVNQSGNVENSYSFDFVNDFELDFYENIFVLTNNKIENPLTNSYINLNFNCSLFTINQTNGLIYCYNSGRSCLEVITNNFSAGLKNYPHNTDIIYNNVAYNQVINYGKINAGVFIYNNVNYVGNFYITPTSINALILDEVKFNNIDYIQIGYILNNKINVGYINKNEIQIFTDALVSNTHNLRTANKVYVLKYPTIASNVVIDTIEIGTPITAIGTYKSNLDNNGFYYVIKVNDKIGYVYNNDVITNTNISAKLETNAQIKILDHTENINLYSDKSNSTPLLTIKNNQRIYVKNYDKSQEFTLISYTDENHVEHVGYVYTKYVKMDGLSTATITAIILLSTTFILGIILISFYVVYKKKNNVEKDEDDFITPKNNSQLYLNSYNAEDEENINELQSSDELDVE